MKIIKLSLLSTFLVCSLNLNAKNPYPIHEKTCPMSIESEIANRLLESDFCLNSKCQEMVAKVSFTINKNREIVVLFVDSDSEELEYFIKDRLNYYKTSVENVFIGQLYTLPVRFKN